MQTKVVAVPGIRPEDRSLRLESWRPRYNSKPGDAWGSGISVIEDHLAPTAFSKYLTGTFVWDTRDLPRSRLLEGLEKIGQQLKLPTVLIPTGDVGAILIAEEALTLRQWFLFPKLRSDIPRSLVDKSQLHTLCKQLGVPCPQAISPGTISEVYEFIETAAFRLW